MQIQNFLIRKTKLRGLILAVTALAMAFSVRGQEVNITLPLRELTARQVLDAIESQTNYDITANSSLLDGRRVRITRSPATVASVIGQLLEGTDMTYVVQGNDIVIYEKAANVNAVVLRQVDGTVHNSGVPQSGVLVEILDVAGARRVTDAQGRFSVGNIPAGTHIARLTSADGSIVRYREMTVNANNASSVMLSIADETRLDLNATAQPAFIPSAVQTTAYFVPNYTDHTIRAFSDEPQTQYSFVPTGDMDNQYLPKAAVKTNLLYLAATNLNLGVEFGLAPRWTLDVSAVFNPFELQDGGINRFGLIQPEARYWFCQRFEKHFVGLHGLYGRFNVGEVDFLTTTFETHRYKGWGAGAGVSYGYHLPLGKRWAMEFTVGAGYVYLEYDKFRCYDCDEFVAKKNKHYFGPTKAGVSLIFMIK